MTNILTSVLMSALSFTYQPDVRTAYISRGRISEDRPIQSNLLRLDVSLDEWGCDVMSVAGVAVAAYLSINLSAACFGMFVFFKEYDASSFAEDETCTTLVER